MRTLLTAACVAWIMAPPARCTGTGRESGTRVREDPCGASRGGERAGGAVTLRQGKQGGPKQCQTT